VETAGDLGPALKTALDSGLPTVIDVPVAAAAQPSAATWDLPPLPHPEPSFGWPDPANPATE
jgi:acetolactate synthase-1/2/3 large subunit